MDSTPHHLLTLWNPSYAADAMDEHLRVLLDWAGRWRRGEAPDDEVYVWWGRLRSPNRKGALPHADAIAALDAQIRSGAETHLYLTDYRSLYVAHLGEVTAEHLPQGAPGELEHMPHYYRSQFADFWFRLWDIRRLVADDTPAVIEELKRLRNRMAPGSRRRARRPDTFGRERIETRTDRTAFRERFPRRIARRIARERFPTSFRVVRERMVHGGERPR